MQRIPQVTVNLPLELLFQLSLDFLKICVLKLAGIFVKLLPLSG